MQKLNKYHARLTYNKSGTLEPISTFVVAASSDEIELMFLLKKTFINDRYKLYNITIDFKGTIITDEKQIIYFKTENI